MKGTGETNKTLAEKRSEEKNKLNCLHAKRIFVLTCRPNGKNMAANVDQWMSEVDEFLRFCTQQPADFVSQIVHNFAVFVVVRALQKAAFSTQISDSDDDLQEPINGPGKRLNTITGLMTEL